MNLFIILLIIIIVISAAVIFIKLNTGGLSEVQASTDIQKLLNKSVDKKNISGVTILIDSPQRRIDLSSGEYSNGKKSFHIASVGKAFTASLIGVLIDEGKISLDDKISTILNFDILEGLFIVDGKDYRDQVTIGQLLNHTSGIADYFEDNADNSDKIQNLILSEPNRFWTPTDLIEFTRDFQKAVGIPGSQFHYSDTGYILLGLIIENMSGKTLHEILHEKIFSPLYMKDSYLMFYSRPAEGKPLADVWLNGVNIKNHESLSIDWAGGGIISTTSDLAIFIRALNNYEIVSEQTLKTLCRFDERFMRGIHYGYGFMEYHFSEFFPGLGFMPAFRGHMGVLGTQMFYASETDTVFIASFGSTDFAAESVKTMIKIIGYAMRIED